MQHEPAAKDRIVTAARLMFSARGFHQTAMADLAAAAKVSVGAIYRAFESKSDIIQAIVVEDTDRTVSFLVALQDRVRSGELRCRAAFHALIEQRLCDAQDALTLEVLAEGYRNADVQETIACCAVKCRKVFRDLAYLANPAASESDLDGAEELLLTCTFGLGHRGLARRPLNDQEAATALTHLIFRALAAPQTPEDARDAATIAPMD